MRKSRFQSFEDITEPATTASRLAALRARMEEAGIAAWVQPRTDAWQNEYLRACDERLAWLSGFTGSAGLLVVLREEAALFVDGRYTLQAAAQVDDRLITVLPIADHEPHEWLARHMKAGEAAGFDPWLMTRDAAARYEKALAKAGARWLPLEENPVDAIWQDRPEPPRNPLFAQPIALSGMATAEKLALVRRAMEEHDADHAVITLADSLSWLFNIRGRDIPHTPVALGFAIVGREGAELFLDSCEVGPDLAATLERDAVLQPLEGFEARLSGLGRAGAAVLLDEGRTAARPGMVLREHGARLIAAEDPCILPKARKTEAEIAGARAAHARDGAAMARFLCWLEREAAGGAVDEIAAAERLEAFRIETAEALGEPLFDLSFDTISAAGEHGAIVHYRVTTASNRPLKPGELYLVDSGGQYRDGTTDITRTVFIGPAQLRPAEHMRRHFTLVLKGMIGLASVRFPPGTSGANLDALARRPLWDAGLDYDHGTGHGVGSFLCVHEGPQSISRIGRAALEPGMITSNEPGYYREGHYGIRIENLILCRPPRKAPGEERKMLRFETLTLCPIDRRLIDAALLSAQERAWLDAYHATVAERIGPLLGDDTETKAWLARACAPLEDRAR